MWQAHHNYLVTDIVLVFLIRRGDREEVNGGVGEETGEEIEQCVRA
jgi:hypothetical protein